MQNLLQLDITWNLKIIQAIILLKCGSRFCQSIVRYPLHKKVSLAQTSLLYPWTPVGERRGKSRRWPPPGKSPQIFFRYIGGIFLHVRAFLLLMGLFQDVGSFLLLFFHAKAFFGLAPYENFSGHP